MRETKYADKGTSKCKKTKWSSPEEIKKDQRCNFKVKSGVAQETKSYSLQKNSGSRGNIRMNDT